MDGLFTQEEIQMTKPIGRLSNCGACKLYKTCESPKMKAVGEGHKKILIIGDMADEEDDKKGTQFIGKVGQVLRRKFRKHNIDLNYDCRIINTLACRTSDGKDPTEFEIDYCRPKVLKEINNFEPHLILLLGTAALQSFLSHRWTKKLGNIDKWRGLTIPDREFNAWVCPVMRPLDVFSMQEGSIFEKVFDKDLARAFRLLEIPVYKPLVKEQQSVHLLFDQDEIYNVLSNIYEFESIFAFDYETTGLKPHAEGHKIVTCGISTGKAECAYSFFMPEEGKVRAKFRKILNEPRIKKFAHNIKFEDNWTEERLPGTVRGWEWDSMLVSHIFDNRKGVTSLKFQAYINFGILPYDEHIEPFLRADGSNSFNRIYEIPPKELLLYGGMDALLELRLALKQQKQLGIKI